MLEQLVVSSGRRREGRKFRLFFLGTAVLVMTGCFSVLVWSIMAMEVHLTDDGLELSAIVAPVPIPAAEPPKPEPEPQAQPKQQQVAKTELPTRQVNMTRTDELTEIPDRVSTTPNTQKARPNSNFNISKIDSDGKFNSADYQSRTDGPGGPGGSVGNPGPVASNTKEEDKPPVMVKKPVEEKKPTPPLVHSSIINSKAVSLPKPNYPPTAVAVGAAGEVNVKVLLDENGNVVSAQVVSGHPLLRQAALQAARSAKFTPTFLNGEKVKVDGMIVYRFSRT